MLLIKPNCECCDKDLPPDAKDARICTFECTFCEDCVTNHFQGVCPNCGGDFVQRPIRPSEWLAEYPASPNRFTKDHEGCAGRRRSIGGAAA